MLSVLFSTIPTRYPVHSRQTHYLRFHSYPSLVHQLTYRRTNHDNLHVRGYKEEGTITTAFDMTVQDDLDRFRFVIDTIDRVPQIGVKGQALKQRLI